MSKLQEKERAIRLRKRGLSYSEILKKIPVAKSTLSLWLRNVDLAKRQRQRLSAKKLAGAQRGWEARRRKRILLTEMIKRQAREEINKISNRDLWMLGIALYWAEGSKEKGGSPRLEFSNSNSFMIKLFIRWILEFLKVNPERIKFELFIHKNHKKRLSNVKKHWSQVTGFPLSKFTTIYFKKHKIKTNRKNIGNNYYGVLKIRIRESSSLNRRVTGWIEGINHCLWGVV